MYMVLEFLESGWEWLGARSDNIQWRLSPGFTVNTITFALFWPHTHKCNVELQVAAVPDLDPIHPSRQD